MHNKALSNFFPVLVLAVLAPAQALAADTLVFHNGDQITGDITRILDTGITIKPAYTDEFQVEVDAVAYVDAKRDIEIELADGRIVVAQLLGADDEGRQIIAADGEQLAVALADLKTPEEPEAHYDRDSHIDWSTALNTGNTESLNTLLRGDTTIRIGDHRHIVELSIVREEQDFDPTKEQDLLVYNYNWLFRNDWFLSAAIQYESDPIRELEYRYIGSVGIGLDIWDDPGRTLNVQLGAGYTEEEIGLISETSSVATWRLRYRQDFFAEDLELFHNHSITQYVSGRDNVIYKTSTGVRYEITDLLYANVSLNFDYESQPVATASNEDLALVFGVGMEF